MRTREEEYQDQDTRRLRRLYGRLRWVFAPTQGDCQRMLNELAEVLGGNDRDLAEVLGPSRLTIRSWRQGKMSCPSRRLIWLCWCLFLHPGRIRTEQDLITWGRSARLGFPSVPAPPGTDGEGI